MLKLLHTANWHLGRRFPSFPERGELALSRARMEAVTTLLDTARRHAVHAILCAGDLFDDPSPPRAVWEGLAKALSERSPAGVPVFLVPGNHDPLTGDSVWATHHPFRARLPPWIHVVDRDDFTWVLSEDAVLYARPCRSAASELDLAMALPARDPGDERLRIGCVHGSTPDLVGHATNFPIQRDAGVSRGFDYLALGEVHSFEDKTPELPVPTVYPGAPEPLGFDEPGAGHVAVVALFRHGRRALVEQERVAFWRWMEVTCRDLDDLVRLLTMAHLDRHVLKLRLEMRVSLTQSREVERILGELEGSESTHGRAGVLWVDRTKLRVRAGTGEAFRKDLPPVLQDTISRLLALAEQHPDDATGEQATRALGHLYQMLERHDAEQTEVVR
jgi:DNA repair exonuclease SbcCD nuclease subunit